MKYIYRNEYSLHMFDVYNMKSFSLGGTPQYTRSWVVDWDLKKLGMVVSVDTQDLPQSLGNVGEWNR